MTTGNLVIGEYGRKYFRRTWSGVDDPAHKAWNTYSSSRHSDQGSDCCRSDYPSVCGSLISCRAYNMNPWWNSNLELRFLLKIAEQVKGHSFNLAVYAAEGGKAVGTVAHAARNIAYSIRMLRKGEFCAAARWASRVVSARRGSAPGCRDRLTTKDIASTWLAVQYAWRPLIADTYESVTAYHALYNSARSSVIETYDAQSMDWLNPSASPSQYSCNGSKKTQHKMKTVLTAWTDPMIQLGLTNPATVAWELVPLSFVVDWFVPIGSFFEAVAEIPNINGTFYRTERTTVEYSGPKAILHPVYQSGCSSYGVERSFMRHPASTTLSVPKPRFAGLGGLINHSQRVASAIALLRNAIR